MIYSKERSFTCYILPLAYTNVVLPTLSNFILSQLSSVNIAWRVLRMYFFFGVSALELGLCARLGRNFFLSLDFEEKFFSLHLYLTEHEFEYISYDISRISLTLTSATWRGWRYYPTHPFGIMCVIVCSHAKYRIFIHIYFTVA